MAISTTATSTAAQQTWRPTNIATRQEEANVLKSLPVFPVPSISSSHPALYAVHGKVQNMLEVHIDNRVLYI